MSALSFPWETPPPPGAVTEVAPGILWARLPLPMALDHVNVYLLRDDDGWTVVDTGLDWAKGRDQWQTLLEGPLSGAPIARVLVTHHHPDHVGLAGWFQSRGAELWAPRTAWLMARMLVLDEQPTATTEAVTFWTRAGMDPEILAQRQSERPFNFADVVHPMPVGFRNLAEGDRLHLAGRDWSIRLGQGHAPDHATLWSEDIVLGGDQLLPGISPNLSVYPTEPEADPVRGWIDSCQRFAAHARPSQLVLPGHKLPFRGLPHRLRQLEDNHHSALDRLRDHLHQPRVASDCFAPLFKREITGGTYGLALGETVAHLTHLWHRGDVTRALNDAGAWLWRLR